MNKPLGIMPESLCMYVCVEPVVFQEKILNSETFKREQWIIKINPHSVLY